jgi:tRNA-dihydrouridine synthase
MADPQHQIELDVGAALKCAEEATWATNELVGRTLETAVSGKEAATTLHHAYSAQVQLARVLDWAKEWVHAHEQASSDSSPTNFDEWLNWMRRAHSHAEKLCRCFPTSENGDSDAPRIAEWAERWPQDYLQAKGKAERSLQKIETAIETIERQRPFPD